MRQPGLGREGVAADLRDNGYINTYGWVLLLSTWNHHSIVNRLPSNTKERGFFFLIFLIQMPQREPLPPPESKGGCMIQLNRLERPYSQSWPRTSSESIRTNPRMFSAMMVKKIHPFPYLELSGSEPGGGKGPPPTMGRKPTWSLTEERIQEERFLMILFRNLVQPQLMRFSPPFIYSLIHPLNVYWAFIMCQVLFWASGT